MSVVLHNVRHIFYHTSYPPGLTRYSTRFRKCVETDIHSSLDLFVVYSSSDVPIADENTSRSVGSRDRDMAVEPNGTKDIRKSS